MALSTMTPRYFHRSLVGALSYVAISLCLSVTLCSGGWSSSSSSSSSSSEPSSVVLRMHRMYVESPPHETSLYDVMGVHSNATLAQITKAYRRRSRDLHPDKRRHDGSSADSGDLESLREAYEVLKDDSTRLPYHRFGLLSGSSNEAAVLLTGGSPREVLENPYQTILLQLMGYSPHVRTRNQRIQFLVANLVETIRPVVESVVTQEQLAHEMVKLCEDLKTLPLGSQILRCIGRAYRHTGQSFLRREQTPNAQLLKLNLEALRSKVRNAKDFVSAAVASGKLVFMENKERIRTTTSNNRKGGATQRDTKPSIECKYDDILMEENLGLLHSDSDHAPTEDDIREKEFSNAQAAVIKSLQVEALWKIAKIDLDRTIQEACERMLSGSYFFYNYYPRQLPNHVVSFDGWVGSSGQAIDANVGKLRAAAALVLMGDVLVRCSKQGTSWVD